MNRLSAFILAGDKTTYMEKLIARRTRELLDATKLLNNFKADLGENLSSLDARTVVRLEFEVSEAQKFLNKAKNVK